MDTLSFAFGVLTVAFTAVAVVAVVSIVKVHNLNKTIVSYDTIYTMKFNGLDTRLVEHMRAIDNVNDSIYRELEKDRDNTDRRFVDTYSYIDSRVDKALDATRKEKQVLKG